MAQTVKATRRVALGKLKPYPRNPRRGDVAAIKASLEAHGQYRALVVNKDGTVLAGNHTLLALRETGARDALCHFVDVDDDEAARIVLADNRTNDLAGYDEGELVSLLQSLPDVEGTGYSEKELVQFAATVNRAGEGEGAGTAAPETFDVLVSCGSALEQGALIERLSDEGLVARAVQSANAQSG